MVQLYYQKNIRAILVVDIFIALAHKTQHCANFYVTIASLS